MGTAVIPGRDTSPVLQPAECIFNEMPLLIQCIIKGKCFISVFSGWHADRHPSGFQRFTQPRCVVASVCQKRTVIGEEVLENGYPFLLSCPSVSKSRTGRPCPSQTIWNLEFRPTFVRSIRRGESPF